MSWEDFRVSKWKDVGERMANICRSGLNVGRGDTIRFTVQRQFCATPPQLHSLLSRRVGQYGNGSTLFLGAPQHEGSQQQLWRTGAIWVSLVCTCPIRSRGSAPQGRQPWAQTAR